MWKHADTEQENLIENIVGSPEFKGSKVTADILRFLFDRRFARHGTVRKQISIELDGKDGNAVGMAISDLRNRLVAYAESSDGKKQKWLCGLPQGDGHRLSFSLNPDRELSPTERFWLAHTVHPSPVVIVNDDLLFFFNLKEASSLRFFDTNVEDIDYALDELKKRHPNVDTEDLRPAYGYEGAGQRVAVTRVADWFLEMTNKKPVTTSSRNTTRKAVIEGSPVLIGHSRTNPYIRRLMDATECSHLAYRCLHGQFAAVEIRGAKPEEKAVVKKFGPDTREKNLVLSSNKDDIWFGTATRIRHPGRPDEGLTMITSDVEFALREIGVALTQDGAVARMLAKAGFAASTLPPSFEMLFSVKLAPGNMLDEAGSAELLCCRTYDN